MSNENQDYPRSSAFINNNQTNYSHSFTIGPSHETNIKITPSASTAKITTEVVENGAVNSPLHPGGGGSKETTSFTIGPSHETIIRITHSHKGIEVTTTSSINGVPLKTDFKQRSIGSADKNIVAPGGGG